MVEIEVTSDPRSLRTALGLTDGRRQVLWTGRIQNRGPGRIFRTRAAGKPSPASVRGWVLVSGQSQEVTVYSDDLMRHWVWTDGGASTLVCEAAGS